MVQFYPWTPLAPLSRHSGGGQPTNALMPVTATPGRVALPERLRWPGRGMDASVSREARHWFLHLQVEVPDRVARRRRTGDGIIGVDLGVITAAPLSSGKKIDTPRQLKAALRHLRIRARRLSRKLEAAQTAAGITGRVPKRHPAADVEQPGQGKPGAGAPARTQRARAPGFHKLTARLRRDHQAVEIADLNARGMLANPG